MSELESDWVKHLRRASCPDIGKPPKPGINTASSTQMQSRSTSERPTSLSMPTGGHRSRAQPPTTRHEFDRGYNTEQRPIRQLFDPDSDSPRLHPKLASDTNHPEQSRRVQASKCTLPCGEEHEGRRIPQPEMKPISHEQLADEVKGIYAELVMVEAKCIEVDAAQSSTTDHQINNEQWQALLTLHRTLLHKHHDFFLASKHPAASEPLRRLAAKYAMPARMWRHGIHSFLELLRHKLPASYEDMLTFIYMAYDVMKLLYEIVSEFGDAWIERLGDLARYRMAIENDDMGWTDRDIWTGVARSWHSLASEKERKAGRLNHDLELLARPGSSRQELEYWSWWLDKSNWKTGQHSPTKPYLSLLGRIAVGPFFGASDGFKRLFRAFQTLPFTLKLLGLILPHLHVVLAEEAGGESNVAQKEADIPEWVFPIIFLLVIAYAEAAGRYYGERRRWYMLALAPSNLSFPWLAEHERISPMLTGRWVYLAVGIHCANQLISVFATAVYLGCAFALVDYDELRPGPV